MSTMSNIATTVQLAFDGPIAPLINIADLNTLREAYQNQDGENHWFDKSTLEFFGSKNLELYRSGITIEDQTNAPDGMPRHSVVAWVYYSDNNRISPVFIERFETRDEARNFVSVIHDGWYDLI